VTQSTLAYAGGALALIARVSQRRPSLDAASAVCSP